MLRVVVPPASWRYRLMPSCRSTSSIRTIDVIDSVPSLIASAAECEWASMMPGVTYLPAPSMTFAPAGTATSAPTAAILPSRMTIVPFGIVAPDAVMIVAFVMATSRPAAGMGSDTAERSSAGALGGAAGGVAC